MIEKLLNKLGYVKKPENEEEVLNLALDSIGDFTDLKLDKKFEKEVFDNVAGIDGVKEYLRDTIAQDVKRYFKASTDSERDQVRGAYSRTLYLRSLIIDPAKIDKKGIAKLPGKRYAK